MNQIGEETSSSSSKDRHGIAGVIASEKKSNCSYGSGFPGFGHDSTGHGGKGGSRAEQERRKGIPWTEEEHR